MERGKKYDSMYELEGHELYKGFKYIEIDDLINRLQALKNLGATHVETEYDIDGFVLYSFKLNPIKQRDETNEEYQRRLEREQRHLDSLKVNAENTRINELKQLRFLKAKYPEEK